MNKQLLPDCPAMAMTIGGLYTALGASFHINENGKRVAIRPEPYAFTDAGASLPALPNANPCETFADDGEYRGAIKVLEYILARFGSADRELIFGLMASEANNEGSAFDFRERLP